MDILGIILNRLATMSLSLVLFKLFMMTYHFKQSWQLDVSKINNTELARLSRESGIVPDILPFAPIHPLQVSWENGSAEFGNDMNVPTVMEEPTYMYWPHEPTSFYTLILTGPDEPDPHNCSMREYQHWLVVNIPGTNVSGGQTLTEYIKPATPIARGSQRYVFVVYLQPKGKLRFDEPFLPGVPNDDVRAHFSTDKFATKYAFGVATAVNYFRVDWGAFWW